MQKRPWMARINPFKIIFHSRPTHLQQFVPQACGFGGLPHRYVNIYDDFMLLNSSSRRRRRRGL